MQKHIWQGVSTLVGTIIGAGILAIPFVVQQAGFWTGILLLLEESSGMSFTLGLTSIDSTESGSGFISSFFNSSLVRGSNFKFLVLLKR